eukprot:2547453-Amphidinium_carterae.1
MANGANNRKLLDMANVSQHCWSLSALLWLNAAGRASADAGGMDDASAQHAAATSRSGQKHRFHIQTLCNNT